MTAMTAYLLCSPGQKQGKRTHHRVPGHSIWFEWLPRLPVAVTLLVEHVPPGPPACNRIPVTTGVISHLPKNISVPGAGRRARLDVRG